MKLPYRILIATFATAIAVPAVSFAAKADRKKKNDPAANFPAADKDNDGVISEAEYIAAKTQFGKLDKDANGKLSKEEFGAGEEAPKKKERKKKKNQ